MELTAPNVEVVPIDDIRPYWRNPRTIPDDALDAVRESIDRYGYQNPIIVDSDGIIITGHTRYSVLRALGYERIPVLISDLDAEKAREYRLVDNRTQEYTSWDKDRLVMELREWDEALVEEFFPHIDLDAADRRGITSVTYQDLEKAQQRLDTQGEDTGEERVTVDVTCPHCFKTFTVEPPETWT